MLPYEQIQQNPERKWHRQLLDRLVTPGVDAEELDDIAVTLEILNDYRAVQPLLDILTGLQYSAPVRDNAGYVLIHMSATIPDDTLHRWWQTGDDVLKRTVLLMSDPSQTDMVLSVVQDPAHPLYIDGIRALDIGFERAEFQIYKIDALQNPNPQIRKAAAESLLWDEPIAAEDALLAATEDQDEDVVAAACDTLQYYPTQRVFRRVSAMEGCSTEYIRDDLIHGLSDPASQVHLRRWLAPIWDMLQLTDAEMTPPEHGLPRVPDEPSRRMSPHEIEETLDEADSTAESVGDFFREMDWVNIPEADRNRLARKFIDHPDHVVRGYATMAFEKWQHADGLVALFHDSQFLVHKSATYHLSQIKTPSREIAVMLWKHLGDPGVFGTHSYETLEAYVAHADPDEARERLVVMAGDRGQTETLRYYAVGSLQEMKARREVESLLPLVLEPPSVTWGFHDILLDAARSLKLNPPDLSQYLPVDHAQIQTAIAPFMD